MTNREKMIEGMKLLKEGCKNIYSCNTIDCPLYHFCYNESNEGFEGMLTPPCDWIVEED